MKTIVLISAVCFAGCTPIPPVSDSAQLLDLKSRLSGFGEAVTSQTSILTENTAILREIRDAVKTPPGNDDTRPVIADSSAVPDQVSPPNQGGVEVLVADCCDDKPTLCITYADFHCPPCERLKSDIKAGKLDAFAITYDPVGSGLEDNRPAIRFERASSATGFAVMYGYDDSILSFLKAELLPQVTSSTAQRDTVISLKAPVVSQPRATKPVVNQSDLISIHNRLHGGGSWTWPGDLATHLRTTHGYNATGVTSRTSASCPGGNCPTSQRTYRRRR